MREHYKGIRKDGTVLFGSLLLDTENKKEKHRVLKEYKMLAGAEKLVKIFDGENECYEEVSL